LFGRLIINGNVYVNFQSGNEGLPILSRKALVRAHVTERKISLLHHLLLYTFTDKGKSSQPFNLHGCCGCCLQAKNKLIFYWFNLCAKIVGLWCVWKKAA